MVRVMVGALLVLMAVAASAGPEAPEWLVTNLERIRDKHGVPALSCAVVADGRVAYCAASGVRKHGSDEAVTVDDPFQLGSITKLMTATLAGVLVDRGLLRWDTTLGAAFPELRGAMRPVYVDVTVSQLLAHQSGMPYQPRTEGSDEFASLSRTLPGRRYEYVRAAVRDEPEAPPGTRTIYGGGCIIVAAMAERVTGRAWEDLMREHVFRPLHMEHAGFGPMSAADAVTGPWEHLVQDGSLVPVQPDPRYAVEPHAPAGRNVYCSAPDLGRFLLAHLPGSGSSGLLRPATLQRLREPVGAGPFAPGWQVAEGGRLLTHDGCNGKNYAVARVDLAGGSAWCAMSNVASGRGDAACAELALELGGLARCHQAPPRTSDSLALGCTVTASNVFRGMDEYAGAHACDGSFASRWATDDGVREAWLAVDLGDEKTVGSAVIYEEYSPRVESFVIEYEAGEAWKVATSGRRIGPRLEVRFAPVTARHVRLRILAASVGPTISEFHLLAP